MLKETLNRPISLSDALLVLIILILLAGNFFWGIKYFSASEELRQTQAVLEAQKTNEKVLDFTKLFIEKVLKAEAEISFETRLNLENAVRNLDDEEILERWNKFVNSQTESEAQNQVKNLLELLVGKIRVD